MNEREIKFRAWDKLQLRMRHGNDNLWIGLSGHLFWQFGYNEPDMISEERARGIVLMQFTGQVCVGKDIYDGDIIQCVYSNALRVWWRDLDHDRETRESFEKQRREAVNINGVVEYRKAEWVIVFPVCSIPLSDVVNDYWHTKYKTSGADGLEEARNFEIIGNIWENPELLK